MSTTSDVANLLHHGLLVLVQLRLPHLIQTLRHSPRLTLYGNPMYTASPQLTQGAASVGHGREFDYLFRAKGALERKVAELLQILPKFKYKGVKDLKAIEFKLALDTWFSIARQKGVLITFQCFLHQFLRLALPPEIVAVVYGTQPEANQLTFAESHAGAIEGVPPQSISFGNGQLFELVAPHLDRYQGNTWLGKMPWKRIYRRTTNFLITTYGIGPEDVHVAIFSSALASGETLSEWLRRFARETDLQMYALQHHIDHNSSSYLCNTPIPTIQDVANHIVHTVQEQMGASNSAHMTLRVRQLMDAKQLFLPEVMAAALECADRHEQEERKKQMDLTMLERQLANMPKAKRTAHLTQLAAQNGMTLTRVESRTVRQVPTPAPSARQADPVVRRGEVDAGGRGPPIPGRGRGGGSPAGRGGRGGRGSDGVRRAPGPHYQQASVESGLLQYQFPVQLENQTYHACKRCGRGQAHAVCYMTQVTSYNAPPQNWTIRERLYNNPNHVMLSLMNLWWEGVGAAATLRAGNSLSDSQYFEVWLAANPNSKAIAANQFQAAQRIQAAQNAHVRRSAVVDTTVAPNPSMVDYCRRTCWPTSQSSSPV